MVDSSKGIGGEFWRNFKYWAGADQAEKLFEDKLFYFCRFGGWKRTEKLQIFGMTGKKRLIGNPDTAFFKRNLAVFGHVKGHIYCHQAIPG